MKKQLIFALALFISAFAFAQKDDIVIQASKKTTKELTPTQIIDSLNKLFPDAKSLEYYETPARAVNNGWAVTEEDNLPSGEEVQYYTVSFKRSDFQYYALFRADGLLVMSKFQEKETLLPEAVKTSLLNLKNTDYKDYILYSKDYFKEVNQGKQKEYYQVVAVNKTNEKDKKTVILDPTGKVLKVK